MKLSQNPLMACVDTLLSPEVAFTTVKDKKGWSWLPFVLLVSITFLTFYYYFSVVDFAWMKSQMLEQIAASGDYTNEEMAAIGESYQHGMMMWSTIIAGTFGLVVMNIIGAIYYNIATKIVTKNVFKFTDWIAFSWWTSLPVIISMLVACLVVYFSSDGLVTLQDLQPTSLNSLIFGAEPTSAWAGILDGITVFSLWVIAIASIGLKAWLNIDGKKAIMLAAAPSIIIYGIWSLYVVFTA